MRVVQATDEQHGEPPAAPDDDPALVRVRRAGMRLLAGAFVLVAASAVVVAVVEPAWYVRWREPVRYQSYLRTHAENYGVPAHLLAAVAQVESGFDPEARSDAGAIGLMQLTPETAQGIADRTGGDAYEEGDLLDPEISLRYGAWYLSHLHDTFDRHPGGAGEDDWVLALAAYNGGQGNVDEWLRDAAGDDDVLQVEEIPFDETREYVERVEDQRAAYERAYPEL